MNYNTVSVQNSDVDSVTAVLANFGNRHTITIINSDEDSVQIAANQQTYDVSVTIVYNGK